MNQKRILSIELPGENKILHLFILACVFLKFLFVAFFFSRVLFSPVNHYEIGEILLNYYQGFQRRSLIGTLITGITHNRNLIQIIIKLLNGFGIACLFYLIFKPVRNYTSTIIFGIAIIFICSPFGMSFYSDLWLKKEILFFPLLVLAISSFRILHVGLRFLLLNGIIVVGCLIHEAFILLALPFLICISYLNKQKTSLILSLPLTAICSLVVISTICVKPEPAMTNYIITVQKMGFDTTGDLTHPVRYMRMGLKESVLLSATHFKLSYTFLYTFLYFLNVFFACRLFKIYLKNPEEVFSKEILCSLVLIHLGIVPLLFFGMDYGRWFSFAFIISMILILQQLNKMQAPFSFDKGASVNTWVLFTLFLLFIHIPQMGTFNIYRLTDYAHAFLTFLKPFR